MSTKRIAPTVAAAYVPANTSFFEIAKSAPRPAYVAPVAKTREVKSTRCLINAQHGTAEVFLWDKATNALATVPTILHVYTISYPVGSTFEVESGKGRTRMLDAASYNPYVLGVRAPLTLLPGPNGTALADVPDYAFVVKKSINKALADHACLNLALGK